MITFTKILSDIASAYELVYVALGKLKSFVHKPIYAKLFYFYIINFNMQCMQFFSNTSF
jgi:hypothetical protein